MEIESGPVFFDDKNRELLMEAKVAKYDLQKGLERIDSILEGAENQYVDSKVVPDRASLTFNNGVYLDVMVMFVDIRGSKILSTKHNRPVLAKIYRAYISEVVALFNDNSLVKEVYIEGDCVWGVFDTPYKRDVDSVFDTAAKISSVIDVLNHKLMRRSYSCIDVGISLDYGRALMIKAGYKGSGVNEVVWVGEVVGQAAQLCSYGNKTANDCRIMISKVVLDNLCERYRGFFDFNHNRCCYHANAFNVSINDWLNGR